MYKIAVYTQVSDDIAESDTSKTAEILRQQVASVNVVHDFCCFRRVTLHLVHLIHCFDTNGWVTGRTSEKCGTTVPKVLLKTFGERSKTRSDLQKKTGD